MQYKINLIMLSNHPTDSIFKIAIFFADVWKVHTKRKDIRLCSCNRWGCLEKSMQLQNHLEASLRFVSSTLLASPLFCVDVLYKPLMMFSAQTLDVPFWIPSCFINVKAEHQVPLV